MTNDDLLQQVRPIPGIDEPRLRAYLQEVLDRPFPDGLTVVSLHGGHSNLTFRIDGAGSAWVLRRPPLGHVMATAHDMGREHALLSGLSHSSVPVPAPRHLCTDRAVIGAPFILMDFVGGHAFRWASQLEPLGPQRTRQISDRMIDVLADLHSVDPAAVGLADIGRAEGFVSRQVRRWTKQLEASSSRPLKGAAELIELLAKSVPDSGVSAIVHGDYRLDNLLVGEDDAVNAVIDWEMATLGDPLTDLALLQVYQRLDRIDPSRRPEVASAAGFASEQDQLARYGASSGVDLSDMPFYLGLAHFKLAVIVESVHFRSIQTGTPVGDPVGHLVEPLLAAGLTAMSGS